MRNRQITTDWQQTNGRKDGRHRSIKDSKTNTHTHTPSPSFPSSEPDGQSQKIPANLPLLPTFPPISTANCRQRMTCRLQSFLLLQSRREGKSIENARTHTYDSRGCMETKEKKRKKKEASRIRSMSRAPCACPGNRRNPSRCRVTYSILCFSLSFFLSPVSLQRCHPSSSYS